MVGVIGGQLFYKRPHSCPLGVTVHRAARLHHREALLLCHTGAQPLGAEYQRTDNGYLPAVKPALCRQTVKASAAQQVHHNRFGGVIGVMTESHMAAPRIQ